MPIDYKKYPPNWKALSKELRFIRAQGRCEQCGAENYQPHPITGSRVILTVAHKGIDKPDGTPGSKTDLFDLRPENLIVLCQRCHLNFDRPENLEKGWQTRKRNRASSGEAQS